jgi:hypothetical protein
MVYSPEITEGYIDSSSIYEVLAVLGAKSPEETYPWALQSTIASTSMLMNTYNLKIAPAPDKTGRASGLYGHLIEKLAEFISIYRPKDEIAQKALQRTKLWAYKNTEKIRRIYSNLRTDDKNFNRWLDRSINNAWLEHAKRLRGLFNTELIPELSCILEVKQNELNRIHQLSRDLSVVNDYIRRRPDEDDFRLLLDAYAISALLRGRYHDYIVKNSSHQIMHHPFREGVLPVIRGNQKIQFLITNTQRYLSNIAIAGALSEPSQKERISTWVENVHKLRIAVHSDSIDITQKDNEDKALTMAVKAAKQLSIRVYTKWLDTTLNATIVLGIGALTSFVLTGWTSFAVTTGAYITFDKLDLTKKLICSVFTTNTHLSELAKFGPGRIKQRWDN